MSAVLELKGVSRSFVQGDETIQALRSTDLVVREGEFVGVLGPSGSGKSTLLTIMGGLRTPSTGQVLIGGQPFSTLREKERARLRQARIGFVLQAAGLVPFLKVRDQFRHHDLVAGRPGDKDRQDTLLEALGISRRAGAYPENLSGGERQRAAIAVALYPDPDLVLADEPTAALDTHRAMDVARVLSEQTHALGKSTVMVTHDERLLELCDRTLRMHDGQLSEDGAARR